MKPIGKRACCLVPMLIVAALFLFVFVWLICTAKSESTDFESEEMHHSVKPYMHSAKTLDTYLQKTFPDDCGDKALTDVELQVWFMGQHATAQALSMHYYRFIDESRAGGNIAVVTFCIDPIKGEITEIQREQGTGKAFVDISSEPVSQHVIALPLALYVENIDELVDTEANPQTRLELVLARGGAHATVYSSAHSGYIYYECMHEWTPGTPFAKREYELREHAWGRANTASPRPG